MTRNWPLPARTTFDAYATALEDALSLVEAFDADAPLIVSAGFDTYDGDPIGDLALHTPDYSRIGEMIRRLGMPLIVLQEGGYAVEALGANAVALLRGMDQPS